mmetsp:Transcript_13398/g.25824  ORF Transcript_13398/g.25824 Transcript_13398/m.25824 type:complete len:235 (-) Transcript_13398:4169-4873(-)
MFVEEHIQLLERVPLSLLRHSFDCLREPTKDLLQLFRILRVEGGCIASTQGFLLFFDINKGLGLTCFAGRSSSLTMGLVSLLNKNMRHQEVKTACGTMWVDKLSKFIASSKERTDKTLSHGTIIITLYIALSNARAYKVAQGSHSTSHVHVLVHLNVAFLERDVLQHGATQNSFQVNFLVSKFGNRVVADNLVTATVTVKDCAQPRRRLSEFSKGSLQSLQQTILLCKYLVDRL